MSGRKLYIRVTKHEDGRTIKRELMQDRLKIDDIDCNEIIDRIVQMAEVLRHIIEQDSAERVETIEAIMQFASSLRYRNGA